MKYTAKQVEQRRRGMIKHRYKMTLEQYDSLLEDQGGVCAICGTPPIGLRLSVDHDHSCCPSRTSCGDCIRGLICQRCNATLGYVESNKLLSLIVEYVDKHHRKYWDKMESRFKKV